MKYRVGDKVKVIKKYNKFSFDGIYFKMKIPGMIGVIDSIWSEDDGDSCYFLDMTGIGFQYKNLELVETGVNLSLEESIHSRFEILDLTRCDSDLPSPLL